MAKTTTTEKDQPADAKPEARTVRVKCISKGRPWTDVKPLDFKEEADVSPDLAKAMEAKEQVVILG